MRKTNFMKVSLYAAGIGIFLLFTAGEIQAGEGVIVTEGVVGDFEFTLEGSPKQISSKVQHLGGDKFFIEGESIVGGETQSIACEVAVEMPFEWIEIIIEDPDPIHWDPEEEVASPPILFAAPIHNLALEEFLYAVTDVAMGEIENSLAINSDGHFVVTTADGVLEGTNQAGDVIVPQDIALAAAEDPQVLVRYLMAQNEGNEDYTWEDAIEVAAIFQYSFNEAAEGMSAELSEMELTDEQEAAAKTVLADYMAEIALGGGTNENEQALVFATPDGDVFIASFDISDDGTRVTYFAVPDAYEGMTIEEMASIFEKLEGGQTIHQVDNPVVSYDVGAFITQGLTALLVIEKINDAGETELVLVTTQEALAYARETGVSEYFDMMGQIEDAEDSANAQAAEDAFADGDYEEALEYAREVGVSEYFGMMNAIQETEAATNTQLAEEALAAGDYDAALEYARDVGVSEYFDMMDAIEVAEEQETATVVVVHDDDWDDDDWDDDDFPDDWKPDDPPPQVEEDDDDDGWLPSPF